MFTFIQRLLPSPHPNAHTILDMHYFIYHGVCYRGANNCMTAEPRYFGDDVSQRLTLVHSADLLPEVVCPSASVLIVAAEVAEMLRRIRTITVDALDRLILVQLPHDMDYDAWKRLYFSLPKEQQLDPLSTFPVSGIEAKRAPEYSEIVVPRYERVLPRVAPARNFRFKRVMLRAIESATINIPDNLAEDCQIFHKGGWFVRNDVFEAIDRFVDRAYFDVQPLRPQSE